jgi:hypothetical protein
MKIWLDDIRPAPEGWEWATKASEAMAMLIRAEPDSIEEMSFDHDLGPTDQDGYWLLNRMEWMLHKYPKTFGPKLPVRFAIHSANPVGRRNMERAIASIERMRNGNV